MYKIVKKNEGGLTKVAANLHAYSVTGTTMRVLESAQSSHLVKAQENSVYYVLVGKMRVDSKDLKKDDCLILSKGDSCVMSGTFKALEILKVARTTV